MSPLSAARSLTKVTGSQDIENVHKKGIADARGDGRGLEHECWGPKKNRCPSNRLGDGSKNVAIVACVREDESAKFPPFYKREFPLRPSPVFLSRAQATLATNPTAIPARPAGTGMDTAVEDGARALLLLFRLFQGQGCPAGTDRRGAEGLPKEDEPDLCGIEPTAAFSNRQRGIIFGRQGRKDNRKRIQRMMRQVEHQRPTMPEEFRGIGHAVCQFRSNRFKSVAPDSFQ